MNENIPEGLLESIILRALEEDRADEDVTTQAIFSATDTASGYLLAKQDGVLSGVDIAGKVFKSVDPTIKFEQLMNNGTLIYTGDKLATVTGPAAAILTAERTALNFTQRMSGIATLTNIYLEKISDTSTKILDTRKTVPGLRYLDKLAVLHGGGDNHRFSLQDMFLIKDNHIEAAGSITEAINRCIKYRDEKYPDHKIEVEADTYEQVMAAKELPVDVIMLDNMELAEMRKSIRYIHGHCKTEASGGVNLDTVRSIALTGVDYISVGALTHSPSALDISLEIVLT